LKVHSLIRSSGTFSRREKGTRRVNPVRQDFTVFNTVQLRFRLAGVTQSEAEDLIDRFKGR
jgi:aspartate/tyrosine/aromatic aminotransferase